MRAALLFAVLTVPAWLAAGETHPAKSETFTCTLRVMHREAKHAPAKVFAEPKLLCTIGKEGTFVAQSEVAVPDGETTVGTKVTVKVARRLGDGRIVVDVSATQAWEVMREEERFQIRTVTHRDVSVLKLGDTQTVPLGDGDRLWCEVTCEPAEPKRVSDNPPR